MEDGFTGKEKCSSASETVDVERWEETVLLSKGQGIF